MSESRDVDRLSAFTDGVLAIAITLLVLDIQPPDGIGGFSDAELAQALWGLWPKYMGYAISFLVIGNYWIGHTAAFRGLKAIDGGLVWLNILFLLAIGFVPFVTSVISENDGRVATTLYAATMIVASFIFLLMWLHARRRGLFSTPVEPERTRRPLVRSLVVGGVFTLSILIAQFDADIARLTWLLLIPGHALTRRKELSGKPADPLAG